MHDQRSPAEREDDDDRTVLSVLLDDGNQRPWAVDEVEREVGDALAVTDSLARLHGAGLVHRLSDGFVFATRPAVRRERLA